MKPIAAMTAQERMERKKARLQKKVTEDPRKASGPPVDRVSLSLAVHFGSLDSEWRFIEGLGWLHISEETWFKTEYRQCSVTGRYHRADEMVRTFDSPGGLIHRGALDNKSWTMCAQSQKAIKMADAMAVFEDDGKMYYAHRRYGQSTDYYALCRLSLKLYSVNALLTFSHPFTPELKRVARYEAKASNLYKDCPRCGLLFERAGIQPRLELGGEMCCHNCYVRDVQRSIIHKHDYAGYPDPLSSHPTVRLIVNGKVKDVPDDTHRLFGVECEVEIQDGSTFDRWQLAINATKVLGKDFIVMKNDGSLKVHDRESPLWGFEMVSAPADLATHRERWSKLESMDGFKYLRAWDTTTCGMHVHIGKASLTTLQVGRIMTFITEKQNRKFIEKVAGRNSAAASRFIDKGLDGGLKPDPDKYCAVNIRPKHTIEFRIFRGTIRFQHIIRNLEFCDAVCAFCHPASRSFKEIRDFHSFVLYCRVNRKRYPILTQWMEQQGMIPASRPAPGTKGYEVVEPEPTETRSQDKWY